MSNLVLIGYRGTGKTTVARLVARQLGWDWVDADVEVELAAGKSIAAIFADDGEPAFRDWEARIVGELCARPETVVALGGGAVIRPENRAAIGQATAVAWLTASPAALLERIRRDPTTQSNRPALTGLDALAEIEHLLNQRSPWYRACATLVVDTEHKSPEQVAQELLAKLPGRQ